MTFKPVLTCRELTADLAREGGKVVVLMSTWFLDSLHFEGALLCVLGEALLDLDPSALLLQAPQFLFSCMLHEEGLSESSIFVQGAADLASIFFEGRRWNACQGMAWDDFY